MKIRLFLLLLLIGPASRAQSIFEYFNSDAFWQRLVVDTPGTRPRFVATDTTILVASNRARRTGNLRFMDEVHGDRLWHFFVYTAGGKWHVLPVGSLSEGLSLLPHPNRDWVVYTEGMGKVFPADLDRGMRLAAQYDVNVLLLDYPSIRSTYKSFRNYKFAINSSRNAYADFVPVLDSFRYLRQQQRAGTGHLSLFFHSMGNNLMREIVRHHLLFMFNNTGWVDNLILNAACVPRRAHHKWVDQIHFANRIYIHFNPEDGTLKWARIAGFHQVLGEHVKRPLSTQAIYVNFHPLTGDGHSNFLALYGRPPLPKEAVEHYRALFHGAGVKLDADRYGPGSYRGIGVDLLPAGDWGKER